MVFIKWDEVSCIFRWMGCYFGMSTQRSSDRELKRGDLKLGSAGAVRRTTSMGLGFPPSPGAGFHQRAFLEKWEEATGAFLTSSSKCPFHPHSVVTGTEVRAFKIHMLKP